MKKNYNLVKTMFFLVLILLVFQIIILTIKAELRQIISACIVVIGFIVVTILMIILKCEVSKIIYEYENEDDVFSIRLLEYTDYQYVRTLLCETPLSNSEQEVAILNEYELQTVDLVRTNYHYIAFDKDVAVALFYVKSDQAKDSVSFLHVNEEYKEKLLSLLKSSAEKHKKVLLEKVNATINRENKNI